MYKRNYLLHILFIFSLFFSLSFSLFFSWTAISKAAIFENESLALHARFGLTYNFYNANFKYFENVVPCGGIFKDGSGLGYLASFSIERNIFSRTQISLGFAYINRSGELFYDTTYTYRNQQNQLADGKFRNTITSYLHYFEIQPDLRFVLFATEKIGMRFFAGVRFAFPTSATFEQVENILSPDDLFFENASNKKSKFRTLADDKISNLSSTNIGTSIGLDNCLKISENLAFTQQINLDYNFTNVIKDKDTDWKTHSLNFALGIRYHFKSAKKENYEPEIPIEETPPEPVEIVAEVDTIPPAEPTGKIIAKEYSGEIRNGVELLATAPIVNAVFFDNNSAELPAYLRSGELAAMDYFKKNALDLHKYVLPHIAKILQENPKATATIEGATAGADFESGGLALARARSEKIKEELLRLGVASKQLKTNARLTPAAMSNSQHAEGVIENQRVDIFVQNAPLQNYTYFVDFSELAVNRQYFIEVRNLKIEDRNLKIEDRNLKIEDRNLKETDSDEVEVDVDEVDAKLYNLQADSTIIIRDTGTYTFNIKRRISDFSTEQELVNKTELSILDKQKIILDAILDTINYNKLPIIDVSENYDNFEAILRFDYNSSALSNDNKQLLREMVEKLPKNYTIQILGSADALGQLDRNEQLTIERASVTRNYINSLSKNTLNIETGASSQKFSETSPAGRFLNRCIIVKIRK